MKLRRSYPQFEILEDRCLLSGGLDPTFGSNGIVQTDLSYEDHPYSIATYPSDVPGLAGKIVAAGSAISGKKWDPGSFAIVRYDTNGSIDSSFGDNGHVVTSFGSGQQVVREVLVQEDGKVLIAGWTNHTPSTDFAVLRYNSDGTPDGSFGSNGHMFTDFGGDDIAVASILQPDGKIVVAGHANLPGGIAGAEAIVMARYDSSGTPDTSFSGDGQVLTTASDIASSSELFIHDLARDSSGRLLVSGVRQSAVSNEWQAFVVRYNADGSLDGSFGSQGTVLLGGSTGAYLNYPTPPTAIAIQPDGQILVAWTTIQNNAPVSVLTGLDPSNGTVDTTFGTSGQVLNPEMETINALAIQSDGSIVATRQDTSDTGQTAKYSALGAPVTGFGNNGVVQYGGVHLAIQPGDDNILVVNQGFSGGGNEDFQLARLLNSDSLNSLLTINDVSTNEGDGAWVNYLGFTVTRSGDVTVPISVDYATADGSATVADNDYQSAAGTLFFAAGEVTHLFLVEVNGDTTVEANETLTVQLSNPTGGATIIDDQGLGIIINDDASSGGGGKGNGKPNNLSAESAGTSLDVVLLSENQIQSLFQEAISRYAATGIDVSSLTGVQIRITDLSGTTLGLAAGNTIFLDDNAAGWGWFVDPTPWDDSEFTTPGNQGEMNHMDLLSALEHELGHVLGLEHEDGGIMSPTLAPGERLGLGSADMWEQALYALAQVQSGKGT